MSAPNGAPQGANGPQNGVTKQEQAAPSRAPAVPPPFGILYSDSGTGKSTACAAAFPHGVFVGPRMGVLAPAKTALGFTPKYIEVQNLEQVEDLLPKLVKMGADALIIDDLSIVASSSFRKAEDDAPLGSSGNVNAWHAFDYIADHLVRFRDNARNYPIAVVANGHARTAWYEKKTGVRWKGRPDLPGQMAPKVFPPATDFCVRVILPEAPAVAGLGTLMPSADGTPPGTPEPTAPAPAAAPAFAGFGAVSTASKSLIRAAWPATMLIDPHDPDWFTKSRFSTPNGVPLNVHEMLYEAPGFNYRPRRAPGMEWVDEVIDQAVVGLMGGASEIDVLKWFDSLHKERLPRCTWLAANDRWLVFRWSMHDLYSRLTIRRARTSQANEWSIEALTGAR